MRSPALVFLFWSGAALAGGLLGPIARPERTAQAAELEVTLHTPLVVDLGGQGIQTTSLAQGVRFDFAGTTEPVRTAWVVGAAAFLALDIDGDGRITSGAELFGSDTPLGGGGTAKNGFEALARYDDNQDGVIDAKDPVYRRLRLWQDRDQNGVSSPDELTGLLAAGIVAIELGYERRIDTDVHGNVIGERARFRRQNGTIGRVYDVYLRATRPRHAPAADDNRDGVM